MHFYPLLVQKNTKDIEYSYVRDVYEITKNIYDEVVKNWGKLVKELENEKKVLEKSPKILKNFPFFPSDFVLFLDEKGNPVTFDSLSKNLVDKYKKLYEGILCPSGDGFYDFNDANDNVGKRGMLEQLSMSFAIEALSEKGLYAAVKCDSTQSREIIAKKTLEVASTLKCDLNEIDFGFSFFGDKCYGILQKTSKKIINALSDDNDKIVFFALGLMKLIEESFWDIFVFSGEEGVDEIRISEIVNKLRDEKGKEKNSKYNPSRISTLLFSEKKFCFPVRKQFDEVVSSILKKVEEVRQKFVFDPNSKILESFCISGQKRKEVSLDWHKLFYKIKALQHLVIGKDIESDVVFPGIVDMCFLPDGKVNPKYQELVAYVLERYLRYLAQNEK